jgi:hypothetical protein
LPEEARLPSDTPQPPEERDASAPRRWELFPTEGVYPPNVADPRHPGFGVALVSLDEVAVPDSSDQRIALALGGRFGLLRLRPAREHWDRGNVVLQLDIEVGFSGQFDAGFGYDNLGWDGVYAFMLTGSSGGSLRYKAGIHHTSSHLGDELIERTGRSRIGYTREELLMAASWSLGRVARAPRVFLEGGWGYDLRNRELQEPGRARAGFELDRPTRLWQRLGWFVAIDLEAFEESGWQVDRNLKAGVVIPAGERRWRAGVAYRDGRVPIGELFQHRESYLALGLWLDV